MKILNFLQYLFKYINEKDMFISIINIDELYITFQITNKQNLEYVQIAKSVICDLPHENEEMINYVIDEIIKEAFKND